MLNCAVFAEKHALILWQADYSLVRLLVGPKFGDLNATKMDAVHARQIARGFGVK